MANFDAGDSVRFSGDGYALLPADDSSLLLTLFPDNENVTTKGEPLQDISVMLEITINR